jgi:hypothetical protein
MRQPSLGIIRKDLGMRQQGKKERKNERKKEYKERKGRECEWRIERGLL